MAAEIGLPEEQWQIQARLAGLYEAAGEPAQARLAWAKAATIIQGLAQGITHETLRAFWPGRRFSRCCSTPNARFPQSGKTTQSSRSAEGPVSNLLLFNFGSSAGAPPARSPGNPGYLP
ncbi:MAG: hypothetical protein ACJ8AG_25590 [Ktedonobacteraceae bacterium]